MRKNLRQAFSSLGFFNPIQPHRRQRILRRHLTLFDFMHRALLNRDGWVGLLEIEREGLLSEARTRWYSHVS